MIHLLENDMVQAVRCRDCKRAADVLDKIIEKFQGDKQQTSFRMLKSYIMQLNGVLFCNCSKSPKEAEQLIQTRNEYLNQIEQCNTMHELELLTQRMVEFYTRSFDRCPIQVQHPVINNVLDYIFKNLESRITLVELASRFHISRSYLSTLIAKETNSNLPHILATLRIAKSKHLLRESNLSILDISQQCGFKSPSYFCAVFKKEVGITPKTYRDHIEAAAI